MSEQQSEARIAPPPESEAAIDAAIAECRAIGIAQPSRLEAAACAFIDAERARLRAAARFLETGDEADDAAHGQAIEAADDARIELDEARDAYAEDNLFSQDNTPARPEVVPLCGCPFGQCNGKAGDWYCRLDGSYLGAETAANKSQEADRG